MAKPNEPVELHHLTKHQRQQFFHSLEAKSLRSRNFAARLADQLTSVSSTPFFLFANLIFFAVWILINSNLLPSIPAFDPYPFGLLTMAVSLEAIVLSIFVLVSQNRQAQTATLREELHLRINQIAEHEITKILEILDNVQKKLKISEPDPELEFMLQDIDSNKIEQSITTQLENAEKSINTEKIIKQLPIVNLLAKKNER